MKIQHNYLLKKLGKYGVVAIILLALIFLTYRAESVSGNGRIFKNEILFETDYAFSGAHFAT